MYNNSSIERGVLKESNGGRPASCCVNILFLTDMA